MQEQAGVMEVATNHLDKDEQKVAWGGSERRPWQLPLCLRSMEQTESPSLAAFPRGLALPRASNYRSEGRVVALVRAGGALHVVQPQALAALGLISQLDLD